MIMYIVHAHCRAYEHRCGRVHEHGQMHARELIHVQVHERNSMSMHFYTLFVLTGPVTYITNLRKNLKYALNYDAMITQKNNITNVFIWMWSVKSTLLV